MKTFRLIGMILTIFVTTTFLTGCSDEYDDSLLTDRVDNLENRVNKLEELCSQMNTNIGSLQTLINALQNRDYITNVTPIIKEEKNIGYTITFAKSNPITIFHGKDGANGTNGSNGSNGENGSIPVIGVKKHTDGIYYWTVNYEWLLDEDGDKIKAEGTDGKDGTNGSNGTNGVNGNNGITPKLKIEDGYWYVSYDNGSTWTELGKATGEDGNNGDNMFNDVILKDGNVTFILNNGVQFTIPIYPLTELTIDVKEAGTLIKLITNEQKNNVTSLTIKGLLNEKDLMVVNLMKNLEILNIKEAKGVGSINPYGERLPNITIKEIVLPKECQNIRIANMFALESIEVSTDSLLFDYENSLMLNTIIYSEGVTVIPNKDYILRPFNNVFFPSSMMRISHDALYTSWTAKREVVITCYATIPPIIGDWEGRKVTEGYNSYYEVTFDEPKSEWNGLDLTYVTVKVPSESISLYQQAKCWRKLNIVAIDN